MSAIQNYFEVLAAVDCSKHVEKKGKFTYLSWSFAVAELLKLHPKATWRVIENPDGWPYWPTDAGPFVKVGVTVEGIERIQIHPVLDSNNKTVQTPNAFQVNTSIQRGLVKAIALHGLGLYIYAGEDLPDAVRDEREAEEAAKVQAAQDAEAAEVQAWLDTIAGCDLPERLDEMGKEIAQAKFSAAAKLKLRTAFALQKRTLEKVAA